mgnify:CR=1 FL=1
MSYFTKNSLFPYSLFILLYLQKIIYITFKLLLALISPKSLLNNLPKLFKLLRLLAFESTCYYFDNSVNCSTFMLSSYLLRNSTISYIIGPTV